MALGGQYKGEGNREVDLSYRWRRTKERRQTRRKCEHLWSVWVRMEAGGGVREMGRPKSWQGMPPPSAKPGDVSFLDRSGRDPAESMRGG